MEVWGCLSASREKLWASVCGREEGFRALTLQIRDAALQENRARCLAFLVLADCTRWCTDSSATEAWHGVLSFPFPAHRQAKQGGDEWLTREAKGKPE